MTWQQSAEALSEERFRAKFRAIEFSESQPLQDGQLDMSPIARMAISSWQHKARALPMSCVESSEANRGEWGASKIKRII